MLGLNRTREGPRTLKLEAPFLKRPNPQTPKRPNAQTPKRPKAYLIGCPTSKSYRVA